MRSFVEFISEIANVKTNDGTGKTVPHSPPYPQPATDRRTANKAPRTTFWLSKRSPGAPQGPKPELVDFSSSSFQHGFQNAEADAAKTRWRVSVGKRPGHLSKEG